MTKRRWRPPAKKGGCPICRRPLGSQPRAKTKTGKSCHASCLKRATETGAAGPAGQDKDRATPPAPRRWDTTAAEREFERNRARALAGETFRSRRGPSWRLGGSPSDAGEIKR